MKIFYVLETDDGEEVETLEEAFDNDHEALAAWEELKTDLGEDDEEVA